MRDDKTAATYAKLKLPNSYRWQLGQTWPHHPPLLMQRKQSNTFQMPWPPFRSNSNGALKLTSYNNQNLQLQDSLIRPGYHLKMPRETGSPLKSHFYKPSQPIEGKKNKFSDPMMPPDPYYETSNKSLKFRIEELQDYLSGKYKEMLLLGLEIYDDKTEQETERKFNEIYKTSLDLLASKAATEIEQDIREQHFHRTASSTKNIFPKAIMWLTCTDFLKKHGHHEKAWSTLIEFKRIEKDIVICVDDNIKLNKEKKDQENGKKSYSKFKNLSEYFIELLYSNAPPKGWRTQENAVTNLASEVLKRHNESEFSAEYPITHGQVETKLANWLKNKKNQEIRSAFF